MLAAGPGPGAERARRARDKAVLAAAQARRYSVVVITLDSESNDPSSNLGSAFFSDAPFFWRSLADATREPPPRARACGRVAQLVRASC